jgi:hypothetical protein
MIEQIAAASFDGTNSIGVAFDDLRSMTCVRSLAFDDLAKRATHEGGKTGGGAAKWPRGLAGPALPRRALDVSGR